MQSERSSLFQMTVLNPLVWIGFILAGMTIANEGIDKAFDIFLYPDTYRNIALGAAVYVGLFDRHYTKDMERLDIGETLLAVIKAIAAILVTWVIALILISNYVAGGRNYRKVLTKRHQDRTQSTQEVKEKAVYDVLDKIEMKEGAGYRVTPQDDGSVIVEVIHD